MRISDWSSDVCSSDLELPDGQVLRSAVYEGEVLVGERLAPVGVHGLAATLPTGTRAVAIPVEPGLAPPLQVGDVVDVLVALAPESAGSGPPGFVLAPSVLVVDVGAHAVAVARSEERRGGKECVGTCRSWWSPSH